MTMPGSLGIPILGFILQDGAAWPANMIDKDPLGVAALTAFKEKVRRKIISYWTTPEDLHGKVSIALMKQFTATPREGWVKASSVVSPQITSELARLSQENGDLRDALQKVQMKATADQDNIASRTISTLRANKIQPSFFYEGDSNWTQSTHERTLYSLFFIIAPQLMVEESTERMSRLVALIWCDDNEQGLRKQWPIPSNALKRWIADLMALELTEPSKKKHPIADKSEYWSLTDFGRKIYYAIRKARLEAGLSTQDSTDEDGAENSQ
jgi:hypothetical protein